MADNVRNTNSVSAILDRYDKARARKQESDALRQEAGYYAWPDAWRQVMNSEQAEGNINTIELYDSTALMAAFTLTSGLFSFLMPAGAFWFGFTAQDPKLNKDQSILKWMSMAASATHKEIWRSNFQREMFMTIRSMVVFGTGIISVELIGKDLVFQSHHVGFMSFDTNNRGEIDTVYRQIFYTTRQVVQEFGVDIKSKSVQKAISSKKWDEKFEFVHVTLPNKDFDETKVGARNKRVKSLYIMIKDKSIVKRGGFDELPYLVARFALVPGEIMGRGPAMELLPEIKMLNRMKKSFIEAAEKAVNPPLIVEDDGVVGQPVTEPNGMIYVRAGAMKPEALDTGTNVALNAEILRDQQTVVKEGFLINRFNTLENKRNMTAFEVGVRKEDDLTIVSPQVTPLQKETLDPLLTRSLKLLVKAKRIDEPPQTFDFDIAYQGRLSLAMASVQANAMEATLAKWAPYAEATPVFENFDFDKAFRISHLASGAPAEVLTDFDQMMEDRKEVNDLQKASIQADIAEKGSKALKNASSKPEEGSAAEQLVA